MAETTIGQNVFSVPPLPAMRSFALQPRIAPAIAQVIGAVGSVLSGGDLGSMDIEKLAPVVGQFFTKLGPEELEFVTRTLLAEATMDGKPLFSTAGDPFNVFMRGRTVDTWRLLWFAVTVNYPDFFVALGGLASLPGMTLPGSGVSSTSPGHAGVSS